MNSKTKKQSEDECGPANAISPKQIRKILSKINVGKNDIFYDLGSGHGRVIRTVVKHTKIKNVIGIEKDISRFCESIRISKKILTKEQKKRVEFICAKFEKYDFSDATIIYEGHEEDEKEVQMYKEKLKKRKVKIIKMDLPLIGYKPLKYVEIEKRRFYIMQYPFVSMKNKEMKWCAFVNKQNPTFKGISDYYRKVMLDYQIDDYEMRKSLRYIKTLFEKRF